MALSIAILFFVIIHVQVTTVPIHIQAGGVPLREAFVAETININSNTNIVGYINCTLAQ